MNETGEKFSLRTFTGSAFSGVVIVALALWSGGPGYDSQPGDLSLMVSGEDHLELGVRDWGIKCRIW